jgi:hypothetical protein
MTRLHLERLTLVLLFVFASSAMLSAQAWEGYVFAGGYGSGNKVFDASMPGGGTWGGKIGGFLTPNFELDGNFSRYNHFSLSDPEGVEIFRPVTNSLDLKTKSTLYEGSGTWNFGDTKVAGSRFSPYLTLGLGVMAASVKNDATDLDVNSVFISGGGLVRNPMYVNPISIGTPFIANPARRIVMEDNDAFFTFSYGGGVKAMRLWGPTGLRADFRGRTIPNFFGRSVTRPELTGGLIFTWGER